MHKLFSILALVASIVSVPETAFSATLAETNGAEFQLNQASPGAMRAQRLGTALIKRREHSLKCVYDFSVKGGAVSTINLVDDQGQACVIPKNAIVRDVLVDVLTTPTSGGSATIALGSGQGASTTDLKAALAFGSWTGLVAGIPIGTAATAIKMTADNKPTVTIATAALTAGKLNVHIKYQISE